MNTTKATSSFQPIDGHLLSERSQARFAEGSDSFVAELVSVAQVPPQCGESEIRHALEQFCERISDSKPHGNLLILVWFSNLKFLNADAGYIPGTSNSPH